MASLTFVGAWTANINKAIPLHSSADVMQHNMSPTTAVSRTFLLALVWNSFAYAADRSRPGSRPPPPAKSHLPVHCQSRVLSYFSVFPCTRDDFAEVGASEREALKILRTCDVFAHVASDLAVQHINRHRQGILQYSNNYTFTVSQFTGRGTKVGLMMCY